MSSLATPHSTTNLSNIDNSVRDRVSEAEWQLRVELAACYRVFDHLGWIELIFNHITLRVPGPDTHFLINPFGLMYSEVTASNLVKIDLDGNKVLPTEWDVNPAGFVIHSAIHAHRDDAHCIMHTHTTTGMAVACLENGLQNDNFYTSMLMQDIAYHDFEGITTELGERERLVANLGDKNMYILRNHGLLTCGHNVADAFFRLWRLQRACDIHYASHAMGGPVIPIADAAVQQSTVSASQQQQNFNTPQLVFDAMVRIVDRKDDSYKN
jgi:ribulose-5-phosphate 4-epimerase/fuculose-1-phosphate aldolase